MRLLLVIFFCACWSLSKASVVKYDSVGTEEKDGKFFTLHKVVSNETLYSLSRRYDVPIYKIIENNPPTEYGLEEGQIIRIPVIKVATQIREEPKPKPTPLKKPDVSANSQKETETVLPSRLNSVKKGKEIIHEVQQKETLFSISRMYEVEVDDIKRWNSLTSNSLDIGQRLIIKTSADERVQINEAAEGNTHRVQPSETLYSLSKTYNVTIDDLKIWNNLRSNELSIGQLLIVNKEPKIVESDPVIKRENLPKTVRKDTVIITQNIDTARYNIQPEERTNFEEVVERGLAEQIAGSENNRKYLALHKTAKTGTLIRVRNEMNNQEIFVRVIGPLPKTSENKNHVIKISKAAYDRLGAIDPRFRVSVSYIP